MSEIEYGKGWMRTPLGALDTVGGVAKIQNPEGADVIIDGCIIQVTNEADAVATVDAGIDDGGDVSNDTLFDGLDVNTATGVFDMRDGTDKGTNGVGKAKLWPADEYLVISKATGACAGLEGYVWVHYVHAG